jgi:hypothetical protein
MIESANHIGDVTGSIAADAPRPGAAGARGDDSADPGLAPPGPSRAPDLSAPQPVPRIAAVWLFVPCLACDGLMMPVLTSLQGPPSEVGVAIAFGIVGCVLAQGNLLAAWLAWSDRPFLRRLLTHWKIAAGLYLIWLVGFGLAIARHGRVPPQIAAAVALGVPLVSLAAQFPLWVARQWFGWRLMREQAEAVHPGEPPLAIRDLMLATLVVAVALALARVAPSPDAGSVWPIWAAAVTVASVISSISLLPAGPLLLRMRPFSRGLAWGSLYAAAWIALVWVIVAATWWYDPALLAPRVIYVGLSSLMFMFAATLMLTAVIARDRGYRLTGGRKRLSQPRQKSA